MQRTVSLTIMECYIEHTCAYAYVMVVVNILCASKAGSPTNPAWAPGSDKTRGQESFGPSTGGPDLTIVKLGNYLYKKF